MQYSTDSRSPCAVSAAKNVRSNFAVCRSVRTRSSSRPGNVDRVVGGVLGDEHHLRDRRMAQVPFGRELLDELLERQILVREGSERHLPHAPEQVGERRIPGEVDAQRERVHEQPDNALELGAASIGDRRGDHDVVLSAVARHQRRERGQQAS